MFDEMKKDLQSAVSLIQEGKYQNAKSTIAYVIYNMDKSAQHRVVWTLIRFGATAFGAGICLGWLVFSG